MPTKFESDLTVKKVYQDTYRYYRNRFEYMERDVVRTIRVRRIVEYDGYRPSAPSVKYEVTTSSYPQYAPYYTGKDERGRAIKYQRRVRHEYDVTLQLPRLSINAPFRGRVGADRKWRFGPQHRPRKEYREKSIKDEKTGKKIKKKVWTGRIIGDTNAELGINGDFFFRCMAPWYENKILFGRNWTNGPAKITNPQNRIFFPKHMLRVVRELINRGVLRDE